MKSDETTSTTRVALGNIEIDTSRFTMMPELHALPILPTRGLVLMPDVIAPINLSREISLKLAQAANEHAMPIGIFTQADPSVDSPTLSDMYEYGVIADVFKIIDLPDGSHTALVKARGKARIVGEALYKLGTAPYGTMQAHVRRQAERKPVDTQEYTVVLESIQKKLKEFVKYLSKENAKEINTNLAAYGTAEGAVNFLCTTLPFEFNDRKELLATNSLMQRASMLLTLLCAQVQRAAVAKDVMDRAMSNAQDSQRTTFLQQQMDVIREELYGSADDSEALRKRADERQLPEAARAAFDKELNKLRRYNPNSPDYAVSLTYLETILDLPWQRYDDTNTDFAQARQVLENDHFGLDKVKQRILEQMAVLLSNPGGKAPILCLVGPPGVGKTSLGKSIAAALGRKYQRVSLGGLHDEAEIRGHRRTYIGAMPGRIMDAVKRSGTGNPVIMLDEIDKIGRDFKGDPEAALLEVLDPEQNKFFHDNYIDLDYDLSHVMFIATANTLGTLQQPLLDRMEVIDLSGYLLEEKVEIARRHLLPTVCYDLNLEPDSLQLGAGTIERIIDQYTSESGVRQLAKKIEALGRKAVLAKVSGDRLFPVPVMPDDLPQLLGIPIYNKDRYEGNDFAGVVTGLAWTQAGGEILLVEVSLSPGKGDRLTVTGNLGDVMKESAAIAMQWVKAHANRLGIDSADFDNYNVHIHFPEGAIPKDGPSAGITMATALVSAFTRRLLNPHIAMTGEITLRGRVLPVGGIKEKILAAKRAGIKHIILSAQNRRHVEDIAEQYRSGLDFVYVDTVKDVIDAALSKKIAAN